MVICCYSVKYSQIQWLKKPKTIYYVTFGLGWVLFRNTVDGFKGQALPRLQFYARLAGLEELIIDFLLFCHSCWCHRLLWPDTQRPLTVVLRGPYSARNLAQGSYMQSRQSNPLNHPPSPGVSFSDTLFPYLVPAGSHHSWWRVVSSRGDSPRENKVGISLSQSRRSHAVVPLWLYI